MSGETTFDLEPNPFERSFASKDSSNQSIPIVQLNDANVGKLGGTTGPGGIKSINNTANSTTSAHSETTASITSSVSTSANNNNNNNNSLTNHQNHQKPDLHIPNISSVNHQSNGKLPGITPPLFTPGGRRLPPLGLSPNANTSGAISNPGTPTTNLWNSLLSATNNHNNPNGNNPSSNPSNGANPGLGHPMNSNSNFNQFLNTLRKTGLTPNESNIRSGLTPGGLTHQFSFNNQLIPGLTTPSALLNSPMTPGLSSLLGMANTSNMGTTPNLPILNPQPQAQQQQQQNIAQNGVPIITNDNQDHSVAKPANVLPSTLEIEEPTESKDTSASTATTTSRKRKGKDDAPTSKKAKLENVTNANTKTSNANTGATRGRKSTKKEAQKVKAEEQNDMNASDMSQDDNSGEPGLDKRKNFLERNRVAASKCRQRKKQLIQKMEDELAFYSTGYRELSLQVNQLRDQVINLKGIIVGHKDCSLLASSVGGINNLNNIIQQANYITQVSASAQTNVSSMPSTIPTTLNIPQPPPPPQTNIVHQVPSINHPVLPPHVHQIAQGYVDHPQAPTQQQPPQLLSSASETPENGGQHYDPNSTNSNPISLPSSGNGEVRLVNSMTNLQSLNPGIKVRGGAQILSQGPPPPQGQSQLEPPNYNNLRPVNSMTDMTLQHHQAAAAAAAHYNGLNV
ncbi:bZIP protein [Scheffersomyces coipomensis]|uniref:bZIP protein n=1 Tax=Scheffersomyces coipomensis TaxID=1788519 RepID=UPI00315D8DD8